MTDLTGTTSSEPAGHDEYIEEQATPPAVRGSFQEIYNALTRQSYIYHDGEWIPKRYSVEDINRESEPFSETT